MPFSILAPIGLVIALVGGFFLAKTQRRKLAIALITTGVGMILLVGMVILLVTLQPA